MKNDELLENLGKEAKDINTNEIGLLSGVYISIRKTPEYLIEVDGKESYWIKSDEIVTITQNGSN